MLLATQDITTTQSHANMLFAYLRSSFSRTVRHVILHIPTVCQTGGMLSSVPFVCSWREFGVEPGPSNAGHSVRSFG